MNLTMNVTTSSVALTVIGSLLLFGLLLFTWYLSNIWKDFRSMALTRIRGKANLGNEWKPVRKWQMWEDITVVFKNNNGEKRKYRYALKKGREILEDKSNEQIED